MTVDIQTSITSLLLPRDAGHHAQGVSLVQALGEIAVCLLFEPPRLISQRPRISFTSGYIISPQTLSAWIGRPNSLTPWCDGLTNLNLGGQMQLTAVDMLAPLSSLKRLDLRSCIRLIQLDGLEHLKHLNWLRLASCRRLTQIEALSQCHELRYLDLSGCEQITSLEPLRQHPNLEELCIRDLRFERFKLAEERSDDDRQSCPLGPLFSLPKLQRVHVRRVWGAQQKSLDELKSKVEIISS